LFFVTFAVKNINMIRTIATPQDSNFTITIPNDYIGKEIEIFYYPTVELRELQPVVKKTMADFWGIISDETAKQMHNELQDSRNGWEERLTKQF
jgi:hypothetical protein